MGKKIDLTGKTFGRLYVLKEYGKNKSNKITWLCRCSCGKEVVISGNSLQRSDTKSCGCLKKGMGKGKLKKHLINKKFGRLTVVKLDRIEPKNTFYLCRCQCGNYKIVRGSSLENGNTKSCGCLRAETNKLPKKDLTGQNFNRLTVLKRVGRAKSGSAIYLCKCKCGSLCKVTGAHLTNGATKSCGCLRTELNRKKVEKFHKIFIGENHPNYKKNKPLSSIKLRKYAEYYNWRKSVFDRDNYTCRCCGQHGGNLNAHHIKPYAIYKEERVNLNNGITLCKKCHIKFHSLYGKTKIR
jgi:5-methylcytosine-specific restriction endonuclease McrA